jgi:hypothetical protein
MEGMNLDISQTTSVSCESCGSSLFTESIYLRKVSGILTGTGHPSYIPIPVFSCQECKHVNVEFLPKGFQE